MSHLVGTRRSREKEEEEEKGKEGGREIRGNVFPRRMRVDLGADSHRGIGHDLRSPSDDWIMRVFAILFGRNHPLPSILHAVDESESSWDSQNSIHSLLRVDYLNVLLWNLKFAEILSMLLSFNVATNYLPPICFS